MSTLLFGTLTNMRDDAAPRTSETTSPPGLKTIVDAAAALVPAEALAAHAAIISATTAVDGGITRITDPTALRYAFWGLLALAVILYLVPRVLAKKHDRLDALRMWIPALASVAWMMAQPLTAFDAAFPEVQETARAVIAVFLAVLLGVAAVALAYQADQKPPEAQFRQVPAIS